MRKCYSKLIAGMCTILLLIGAVGCQIETPTTDTQDPNGSGQPIQSSESAEWAGDGVVLVVGESVDFVSFDPLGYVDGQGFYHYSKLVYETLVIFKNGQAVPALAQSWEENNGVWTFHLREGDTFTDGAALNAEAVKLNFEMLQEHMMEAISYYGGISRITEIETPDEYTLVIHYDAPYYAVLEDLSAIAFGILSPNLFADGNVPYGAVLDYTAGTGPYMLTSDNISSGTSYTFVSNQGYSGTVSGPDEIIVKIIPDPDSRMMAMQTGEIDLLYGSYQITYDMFDYLSGQDGLQAEQSSEIYATRNLLLNTVSDMLSDPLVRKALHYGTDKNQINTAILHGMEQPADTLFPTHLAYCDVEQQVYAYDPEFAISLLEEAGWAELNSQGIRTKDGAELALEVIYMSERSADEQILMTFKGQMASIGVDIIISGYETMTWFEKGLMGEFDISVNDTYGFPQDPHVFVAAMLDYGLDNPAQQGLSQKSDIDSYISAMLNTTNPNVIQEAYTFVLATLQDECVNIPTTYLHEMAIYNTNVVAGFSFSADPAVCNLTELVLS